MLSDQGSGEILIEPAKNLHNKVIDQQGIDREIRQIRKINRYFF